MRCRLLLVSRWRLETSRRELWTLLVDPETWPRWWPHLIAVRRLADGDAMGVGSCHAFEWQSGLGYKLCVRMTTVRTTPYRELEGNAGGDLMGHGVWVIEDDVPHGIRLTYRWDVELSKVWMRCLSPFLLPLFKRRHFAVMASGARGMARELGCRVSDLEEWSSTAPFSTRKHGSRSLHRRTLDDTTIGP